MMMMMMNDDDSIIVDAVPFTISAYLQKNNDDILEYLLFNPNDCRRNSMYLFAGLLSSTWIVLKSL